MAIGTLVGIGLGALVAGGAIGGGIAAKVMKNREAAEVAQAEAMTDMARSAKAVADITPDLTAQVAVVVEASQTIEAERQKKQTLLAGPDSLPVDCTVEGKSTTPACMTLKLMQFQQSDAGRGSINEIIAWSKLAREHAERDCPEPTNDAQ
ncbi:MAG: hypothetical protein P1V36_00090 [Planctomycetota bacterium]|nr:hypothetical protein [Planctomycetota bacterium]